jgi:hypothetical protein
MTKLFSFHSSFGTRHYSCFIANYLRQDLRALKRQAPEQSFVGNVTAEQTIEQPLNRAAVTHGLQCSTNEGLSKNPAAEESVAPGSGALKVGSEV